jgi:hypothetical protein
MNLTDLKCKECGAKLTLFEAQEKNVLCLECYKDTRIQVLKLSAIPNKGAKDRDPFNFFD